MGKIAVVCPQCSHRIEVDESFSGQKLYCAVCGMATTVAAVMTGSAAESVAAPVEDPVAASTPGPAAPAVPPPPAPVAEEKKLKINWGRTANGIGRKCPACNGTMGEDDTVCGACGFNTHTGQRVEEVAAAHQRARLPFGLYIAVLALVAVGVAAWKLDWFGKAATSDAEAVPAPAPAAPPAAGPSASTLAEVREKLRQKMDAEFPLYKTGEDVELDRNGIIVRGTFRGVKASDVVVVTSEGVPREVPFAQLRNASRLRCDEAWRKQELDRQTQAKLAPPPPPASP